MKPGTLRSSLVPLLLGGMLLASPASAASFPIYAQGAAGIVEGAKDGSAFPTADDLKKGGVVLLTGREPWTAAQRQAIEDFVEKGGGVVLVHDAIAASGWVRGNIQGWTGQVPLFFTPPGNQHPVTGGISNFDVSDEMLYGFDLPQTTNVLATTWTPNKKHLKGTEPQPYIYGVSPMIWTAERGKGRVVFFVPGQNEETRAHSAIRTMLRRSLAWAAGAKNVDELSTKEDLATLTYPVGGPLAPLKSVESMQVHPDFKVGLVAAEPLISKPLNIDWDAKGRMWVVESVEYPEGREGGGPESMLSMWQRDTPFPKPPAVTRPGRDKISWIEDTDGDGVMDKKHVFADDLDLATSFCFYRDGVIASQPPEVLFIRDTDGDGKADKREVLYRGLGTSDRHAVLNNLRWGLDGWVYATHGYAGSPKVTSADGSVNFGGIGSGVVRFRPDGSKIEMVSAKAGNCWGVDMTSDGEMFFTQPTSGDLVMHVPVSDRLMAEGGLGSEPSWQVMVHLRPVKPLMSWEEIVENQPNDVIGSFTAACGAAVYEGGAWPKEWTLGYFTAEPTVHIIHHEALKNEGVTYSAEKTREEEFSATRDFWSRPIDTRIGPDGQLYVIDFYNQAILHNDPRGPIHLWYNQAARPDRDHFFGRIHRYEHKQSVALPKIDLSTLEGRVAALSHPNREIRYRAQRLIEEGDVRAAAVKLENAQGVAKIHSLWVRAAAGLLSEKELIAALGDDSVSVRITAARVYEAYPKLVTANVIATVARGVEKEEDARVRLHWIASLPKDAVVPASALVEIDAKSTDRWTRAAVARLARNNAPEVLAAALKSAEPAKHSPLIALLIDGSRADAAKLAAMIGAMESAEGGATDIVLSSLASLRKGDLPRSPQLEAVFVRLSANKQPRIAAAALPLAVSAWPADQIAAKLPSAVGAILAAAPADGVVLTSLAALPQFTPDLAKALKEGVASPGDLRRPLIDVLSANASKDAPAILIAALPSLPAEEKARVVEGLLTRPASAIALIDALDKEEVSLTIVGTTVLPRLADHPDATVKKHAAPLLAKLRGANEAKDAIIARLLPEVNKPGNVEAGKLAYAACAVCHKFNDEGALIGPVLEGMGVHGTEILLSHIVDPNREVEPSYHVWNVTTSDGQTVSGFISRETAGSLFLKNAAGETEIPRAKITSQTNTGKSLMPEGFEGLGAETLRNLVAYLRSGEQRYHTVSFGSAATADGSRGVYLSQDAEVDKVSIKKYGLIEERGVPFHLPDPSSTASGKNVIVLKGGMGPEVFSQTMPKQVEIPVNLAAGRLHLLGAVAGWGYPVANDHDPLVKIAVRYADGSTEDLVFRNGIDFADHFNRVDVPGSAWTDLTRRGQMRYLWRDLKKPSAVIEKLVITSADRQAAPMIAAITLESPNKEGAMAAPPADGGPAEKASASLPEKAQAGTLRVLMAGGGSSHDFGQWYEREDQAILKEAGGLMTAYTSLPDEAAAQLPNADVFLFSSNDGAYAKSEVFRKAFEAFVARGGGLVLLHPATWYNWPDWPAYNTTYVGGGSRAHDPLGEFGLTVIKPQHPVVAGLSKEFKIRDELYQINFEPGAKVETLIETSVSGQTGKKHASVWITAHPKSRIVNIAPGHDEAAHRLPDFRKLLANSVKWAGGK
ncbi:PVC-type heme-binding CxxCH protein [Luteolibacter luteus]|uniref:C-type cytochrome n=1 Tax=Luteolibacter luteus TaxID=2728835 RepID=A0A858RGW0_9BACT|nr:PVC-type heme-binding CxxCH protein [Luteolibacter luteus]QJE95935.1 c-type cytochrome [Luteolibacter luteus]